MVETKSEDKFMVCKNIVNGYCKKINHMIRNGYSSIHCDKCKLFEKKE